MRKTHGHSCISSRKFGDLITADHKVLGEGCESQKGSGNSMEFIFIRSIPRLLMESEKNSQKFLVIYTDNSLEFGKACQDLSWNHCTSTPHRSETNRTAERAGRRIKEGTSAVLCVREHPPQSGITQSEEKHREIFEEDQTDLVQPHDKTHHGMMVKPKVISGNNIYRHHVEPSVKLYVLREESFSIPLKYIDVTRATSTTLDVMLELLERRMDDYWNIEGNRDQSDWTGQKYGKNMSEAAQRKENQKWAIEKPELDNAGRLRDLPSLIQQMRSSRKLLKARGESWKFR